MTHKKPKLSKSILKEIISYSQSCEEIMIYNDPESPGFTKKVYGPYHWIIRTKHRLTKIQTNKVFKFMGYSKEEGKAFVKFETAFIDFIPNDAKLKSFSLVFEK